MHADAQLWSFMVTVFLVSCSLNMNIFPCLHWSRHDEELELTLQENREKHRLWTSTECVLSEGWDKDETGPSSTCLTCKFDGICTSLRWQAMKLWFQLRPLSSHNSFMTLFIWNPIKAATLDITYEFFMRWHCCERGHTVQATTRRVQSIKKKRNAGWMDRELAVS